MAHNILGLGIDETGSLFNEFPPVTIGGPTGNYRIPSDMTSARWIEYRVVSIACSSSGSCIVSGQKAPPQGLDYSGGTTINNDSRIYGEAFAIGGSGTITPSIDGWRRLTSSDRFLYVRIDTTGAMYVSVQFRARILEIIPGPFVTVHPDHMHQMNLYREEMINHHLAEMGIPGYAHMGSQEKD